MPTHEPVVALQVSERPPSDPRRAAGAAPPRRTARRRVKDLAKRGLRRLFEGGQRVGFDILPRHFYSEVPDIRELRRDGEWKRPRSMAGVAGADPAGQFEFVEACCPPDVVDRLRRGIHAEACAANGEPGYGAPDAEFLHAFIRRTRPAKVVQVGCGVATAVILKAADESGYRPEVVCVEPYPNSFLREAADAGRVRLVSQRAQDVPLDDLTDLGDDGLLFVDSTHAVRPGGEVNRLVLEVLPRLRPGSWVHFHDVYFPYDYQRGLLDDELFFSNETPLLHAFLIHNRAYAIRASMSMLHHADPARLAAVLPGYHRQENDHGLRASRHGAFPATVYLQAVGAP